MKAGFCILFSLLILNYHVFAQTKKHTNKNTVMTIVEHLPEFPGGNDSIPYFIARNVEYPQEAIEKNIQGRVIVRFVVDSMGNVTDPEIVRSVNPLLDSAAIAVVDDMPLWKPGEDNGKKVNVFFTLPITFHIDDDSKPKQKNTAKKRVNFHQ